MRTESRPFILPQFGIFAQGTHAHRFLEFDLKPGADASEAVAAFRRLRTPEVSAGGVNLVAGFGAELWRSVSPSCAPADLTPFESITGRDGHTAPAVQHDAWLWLSGAEPDVTWQSARAAVLAVEDVAVLAAEQPGFTYRGGRDVTGFIDGTANPPVRRAADVALVPPGDAGEAGSHVLAMRWIHDLVAFNELSIEEQERVIGRTKPDSIELTEAEKPPTAHIARVELRRSQDFRSSAAAFPTATPTSTVCTSWRSAPTAAVRADAVANVRQRPDGIRDRLTDFSRPVSCAYYFAPSLNALAEAAGPE